MVAAVQMMTPTGVRDCTLDINHCDREVLTQLLVMCDSRLPKTLHHRLVVPVRVGALNVRCYHLNTCGDKREL